MVVEVLIEDSIPHDKIITNIFNTNKVFDTFILNEYKVKIITIRLSDISSVTILNEANDSVLTLGSKLDYLAKYVGSSDSV